MPGFGTGTFGAGVYGVGSYGVGAAGSSVFGPPSWVLRLRFPDGSVGRGTGLWVGDLVERDGLPATLQVTGPLAELEFLFTITPRVAAVDSGCVLERDGAQRFTGLLSDVEVTGTNQVTLTYQSDLIWVWSRIVYPNPAAVWASQAPAAYDAQSGPAETVMLHYVDANVGPGALAARRAPTLTLATSAGRGGATGTINGRFDNVGRLVTDLGEAHSLRFDMTDVNGTLTGSIRATRDLSNTVVYGASNTGGAGLLDQGWTQTLHVPQLTEALVAGSGDLGARVLRQRSDPVAATEWGRTIESLVEETSTGVAADLDTAGDKALADGSAPLEIQGVTVREVNGFRLGTDVLLGDLVGLEMYFPVTDRVRQIRTQITPDGTTVTGVVGSVDAGLTRAQRDFIRTSRRLRSVEAK